MALSIKVADVKVGDVLVSTSGGPDMEVLAIEAGGRWQPNTVTFRGAGAVVTLGLTDPANGKPATTLVRERNHLNDPFWRFMQEPEPTTEDEWRAAMTRHSGRWWRESLVVLGAEKGWKMQD